MKKQIMISKFFASKPEKYCRGQNDDVVIVDNKEQISGSTSKIKQKLSEKKRLLSNLEDEEDGTPKRCRYKDVSDVDTEPSASSSPVQISTALSCGTIRLSEKTKKKLSSFSVDSTDDTSVTKPSDVSVDDLKRKSCLSLTVEDLNADGKSPGEENDTVISSDEEPIPSTSSGQYSLPSSQPISTLTKSQSDALGKFTVVKNKSTDNLQTKASTSNKRTKCKYTPLELQFVSIKEKHPDAVLFVECGYKYRFFGEDAEIAAKVLKIWCHLDHNFMTSSIPTHRLFVHARRLVCAGYKVGVVKQMETAALKAAGENRAAPFTRELTALYTKSTLIGEDVAPLSGLDADDTQGDGGNSALNAHLMCVFENLPPSIMCSASKPQKIAIMSVQPSTGELVYDCFEDEMSRSELETRILHLQPVELLLPRTLTQKTDSLINDTVALSNTDDDRIRIERLDDSLFEHGKAFETVTNFYTGNEKGSELLQDVISLPKQVLSCLAALITYLKEFNLDKVLRSLSCISRFTTKHKYMDLSGNSVRNLEIFNNLTNGGEKGSLFWVMNHTVTKFGSRLLKKWVGQPLLQASDIKERQEAVEELVNTTCSELTNLQTTLKQIPDVEKGLCTIYHQKCSTAEFYVVVQALHKVQQAVSVFLDTARAVVKSILLKQILSEIPERLTDITSFSEAINEKAARENDKTKLFVDEAQFPAIVKRKVDIDTVMSELKTHRREVRLMLKQPSLDYVTVLGTEFLVEVRNAHLKLVPSDWSKISCTKAVTRFHTPFIKRKYNELNQLREKLVLDCTQAWFTFLESFGENYQRYRRAVHHLATLDCLFSLVNVAKHSNFCRPEIVDDSIEIKIDQGRHPVVDQLLGEQDQYVPNDTNLETNTERVMIITGPNMGGKSSYIRQVALIVIMAQVGSYVPAESAKLGVFDAVYTRMGARDEIYKRRSTFMVELQEASEIMAQATEKSLVILDELGRGTSTHDGMAIAHASLLFFITEVKCLTLFVTHYPSLAEFERLYPKHVRNFHMSFMLQDEIEDISEGAAEDAITFLYQLVQGTAASSYGLNVARLADIPTEILKVASRKSRELEQIVSEKRNRLAEFHQMFSSRGLQNLKNLRDDSMDVG